MSQMPASRTANIDDTLIALADPVRRGIVELLKTKPRRAGELAALLDTNAPLMSKHLKTLRDCTLIEEERPAEDARVRVYRLRPERLNELRDWLSDVGAFWSDQLESFKAAADAAAKRSTNEPAKAQKAQRAPRAPRKTHVSDQTVIVSIEVAADPLLAFEVFTTDIDAWWLRGPKHRFRAPWNGTLSFEPGRGGRLIEAYADGTSFIIGRISQWVPGERLVMSWRLPSFADAETTEVDVRFEAHRRRHARVDRTPRLGRAARRPPGATRQSKAASTNIRRPSCGPRV